MSVASNTVEKLFFRLTPLICSNRSNNFGLQSITIRLSPFKPKWLASKTVEHFSLWSSRWNITSLGRVGRNIVSLQRTQSKPFFVKSIRSKHSQIESSRSKHSHFWLFSSSPLSKYRVLCLFYVLLRLNASCYVVKYEEQICSELSICSPRQIWLHYDNVK